MNILVVGGGGREHAIVWKLKQSKKVDKVYAIPGNAGISQIAECHFDISSTNLDEICKFCEKHKDIDMVMVAPDDPLALGLVNKLQEKGIRAFGPTKEASIIESSKAFSKDLMKKYNIPTASYEVFNDMDKAISYVENLKKFPVVVKADGLALGKGVLICENKENAIAGVKQIMQDKAFGSAGNQIVIEEFLKGREVSVLCFTDGKTILPMVSSQDHKRALDGDKGLNTGGMGTFSPSNFYNKAMQDYVEKNILYPTINAMNSENRKFKGVLYFGLMIDGDDIKVLEYNARFGDPETQVILPLLENDLVDVFNAVIDEKLDTISLKWRKDSCVCVILASGGYPENYEKGKPITFGNLDNDVVVFHAGTKFDGNKNYLTNGGRVLGVVAVGKDIEEAREKAYSNVKKINFDGMHYRTDIGYKL